MSLHGVASSPVFIVGLDGGMPRRAVELSDRALASAIAKAAKAGGKRLIAVGGVVGLHLQVRDDGRSWLLRYQAGVTPEGKPWRRDYGMGAYPDVSLAEARDRARELRRMLRDGTDPLDHKRAQAPRVQERNLSFAEAAQRLITAKRPEWRNAKHADQWRSTLERYAFPVIGRMPVDQVEVRHVEEILTPIWQTKTETARRVRMRIEAVLSWATAAGLRKGDNPARWGSNLEFLLGDPGKIQRETKQPALPYEDMPRFMAALRERTGSARPLEFLILTACRSAEVRGARWSEIDLEARTWTIPAERMKAGKEHVVPLCSRALALLRSLPRLGTTDLVFPAADGREISEATMAKAVRLMHEADVKAGGEGYMDPKQGRVAVPHGFRSTFRDWAAERTSFPREVAEMALAHAIGNKTEAAYRRGNLLAKRRTMMQAWQEFLDSREGGAVVPLRKVSAKAEKAA